MSSVEAAREIYKRGWVPIPLNENAKTPKLSKGHGFLRNPPTKEDYKKFDWSGNVGIVCGAMSGIVVLDVDAPEGDFTLYHRDINPNYYITATAKSPNGMHYYFKYDSRVRTSVGALGEGVDIRSDGSYVVGVGSTVEGKKYEWLQGFSPEEVGLLPAPDWMMSNSNTNGSISSEVFLDEPIKEGRRNNTFTSLAGSLVARNLAAGQILDVLVYFNDRWCDNPLEIDELERIVRSVEGYRKSREGSS